VYWYGQYIARSIVMQPAQSTQGWVLNAAGNVVPFGAAPTVPWPGNSFAPDFRALAVD
jgi:hypothetical protein